MENKTVPVTTKTNEKMPELSIENYYAFGSSKCTSKEITAGTVESLGNKDSVKG